MKYYPINIWNTTKDIVKSIDGYDTEAEAKEAGLKAQNMYNDQVFTGEIVRASDCNEAWENNSSRSMGSIRLYVRD